MKWKNKENICIQATVVLILLFSAGVSAVHPTTTSISTQAMYVESTFYQADTPTMTVIVTPPNIVYGKSTLAGQNFATLELSGEGVTTVIGEAQLPTFSRFIEIPQGATPQLLVESVTWVTTSLEALHLPSQIIPVQQSLLKTEGASVEFTIDTMYYTMDTFLPSTIADVSVIGEMRGRNIAFLEISPVQYNPVSGELRIMTRCDLRINLPGSDMVQTAEKIDRYTTSSFEQLFTTTFVNYGSFAGSGRIQPRQEGYLIIVADAFYDAIQPFVSWKDSKGFDTTVTKTSQIPSGPTKENIKAYIVDAYNNWPVPPAYVLLVGDVAQIPAWTGTATGTCTDLYYVTIDAGNYFADIIVSRFPAALPEHVTAMADKTIYYEQGSFPSTEWITKAAFMASESNYGTTEGTHNYVINTYLNPHDYACDKLYCHTYSATTAQVSAALNNGRCLAIYSGHGGTDYWADGPVFHQSDVNSLTNDGIYPFVCSHACITGTYSYPECFGETWLRASHKGGLAFWGASDNTFWDEDDILERSMFKAWWNDSIETIGGMTNKALFYLFQYYSGGGSTTYYFEAYNVLGDSSVKIWRDEPNPNLPPVTPAAPSGPATGEIFAEYSFSVTVPTDPEGTQIKLKWEWGDGTQSEWLGPYNSGISASAQYIWENAGTYGVRVKAQDMDGKESSWSDPHSIIIKEKPQIEIVSIGGGIGLSATVKNNVSQPLTNILWAVSVSGRLIFTTTGMSGTIPSLAAGDETSIKTGLIFGIGRITISVNVGDGTKTATGFLLGPFLLNLQ
jgi:hypothetical protein